MSEPWQPLLVLLLEDRVLSRYDAAGEFVADGQDGHGAIDGSGDRVLGDGEVGDRVWLRL